MDIQNPTLKCIINDLVCYAYDAARIIAFPYVCDKHPGKGIELGSGTGGTGEPWELPTSHVEGGDMSGDLLPSPLVVL